VQSASNIELTRKWETEDCDMLLSISSVRRGDVSSGPEWDWIRSETMQRAHSMTCSNDLQTHRSHRGGSRWTEEHRPPNGGEVPWNFLLKRSLHNVSPLSSPLLSTPTPAAQPPAVHRAAPWKRRREKIDDDWLGVWLCSSRVERRHDGRVTRKRTISEIDCDQSLKSCLVPPGS